MTAELGVLFFFLSSELIFNQYTKRPTNIHSIHYALCASPSHSFFFSWLRKIWALFVVKLLLFSITLMFLFAELTVCRLNVLQRIMGATATLHLVFWCSLFTLFNWMLLLLLLLLLWFVLCFDFGEAFFCIRLVWTCVFERCCIRKHSLTLLKYCRIVLFTFSQFSSRFGIAILINFDLGMSCVDCFWYGKCGTEWTYKCVSSLSLSDFVSLCLRLIVLKWNKTAH